MFDNCNMFEAKSQNRCTLLYAHIKKYFLFCNIFFFFFFFLRCRFESEIHLFRSALENPDYQKKKSNYRGFPSIHMVEKIDFRIGFCRLKKNLTNTSSIRKISAIPKIPDL